MRKNNGFTLIEVLVGLTIIAVLAIGAYTTWQKQVKEEPTITPTASPTPPTKNSPTSTTKPTTIAKPTTAPTLPRPATNTQGKIAFVRGGDIWLINADGSGERQLTFTGGKISRFAWGKEGNKIYYMKTKTIKGFALFEETPFVVSTEIIERNLTTNTEKVIIEALPDDKLRQNPNRQYLKPPLSIADLSISPDGKDLIYSRGALWKLNLTSGPPKKLLPSQNQETSSSLVPPAFAAVASPAAYYDFKWSPDGRWLLVTLSLHEGADYYVINWETGELKWQADNSDNIRNHFSLYPFGFWLPNEIIAVKQKLSSGFDPKETNSLVRINLSTSRITELAQIPGHSVQTPTSAIRGTPFVLYTFTDGTQPNRPTQVFRVAHNGDKTLILEDKDNNLDKIVQGSLRNNTLLVKGRDQIGLLQLKGDTGQLFYLATNASSPAWQPVRPSK